MDLIFKFGEHYYEENGSFWLDLLFTFIGAFLGFGFALLLYYFQQAKEKKKELLDLWNERKDRLKYFSLLLQGVVEHANKQLNYLDEYIGKQSVNLLEQELLKQSASKEGERVYKLDDQGIFISYREFQKSESGWIQQYKELFRSLDFVTGGLREVIQVYNNHCESEIRTILAIKDIIERIPDKLTAYAKASEQEHGTEARNSAPYLFLTDWVKRFHQLMGERANLERMNSEYLFPLIQGILKNYRHSSFSTEILDLSKRARVKMNDVKTSTTHLLGQFKGVRDRLESNLTTIRLEHEKLETLK